MPTVKRVTTVLSIPEFWNKVRRRTSSLLDAAAKLNCPDTIGEARYRLRSLETDLSSFARQVNRRATVRLNHESPPQGSLLELVVSCDGNPFGMDAVRALVAAAPNLPVGLTVRAFKAPIAEDALQKMELQMGYTMVKVADMRFSITPSVSDPARHDVRVVIPWQERSANDEDAPAVGITYSEEVPGTNIGMLALRLGIGEERMMTKVGQASFELTEQVPVNGMRCWELGVVLDQQPGGLR